MCRDTVITAFPTQEKAKNCNDVQQDRGGNIHAHDIVLYKMERQVRKYIPQIVIIICIFPKEQQQMQKLHSDEYLRKRF